MLPRPDFTQEVLLPNVVPSELLISPQLLLHYSLCGNTSVVETWYPQRRSALHPVPTFSYILAITVRPHTFNSRVMTGSSLLPANYSILDGSSEGMTYMQPASDIGWRKYHHKLLIISTWLEVALFIPPVIPC